MVKDIKVWSGHVSNEEYLMQRRKQALQVNCNIICFNTYSQISQNDMIVFLDLVHSLVKCCL